MRPMMPTRPPTRTASLAAGVVALVLLPALLFAHAGIDERIADVTREIAAELAADARALDRLQMFDRLFAQFRARGSRAERKERILTSVKQTTEVAPIVLSHAIARLLKRDRGRANAFMPAVPELLVESAHVIRECVMRNEGRDPSTMQRPAEIDVERWLREGQKLEQQLAAQQEEPSR